MKPSRPTLPPTMPTGASIRRWLLHASGRSPLHVHICPPPPPSPSPSPSPCPCALRPLLRYRARITEFLSATKSGRGKRRAGSCHPDLVSFYPFISQLLGGTWWGPSAERAVGVGVGFSVRSRTQNRNTTVTKARITRTVVGGWVYPAGQDTGNTLPSRPKGGNPAVQQTNACDLARDIGVEVQRL